MIDDPKQILTQSISTPELERRWTEVRKKMKEEGIDFLVMQNDNEWLGGYVKCLPTSRRETAIPSQ